MRSEGDFSRIYMRGINNLVGLNDLDNSVPIVRKYLLIFSSIIYRKISFLCSNMLICTNYFPFFVFQPFLMNGRFTRSRTLRCMVASSGLRNNLSNGLSFYLFGSNVLFKPQYFDTTVFYSNDNEYCSL